MKKVEYLLEWNLAFPYIGIIKVLHPLTIVMIMQRISSSQGMTWTLSHMPQQCNRKEASPPPFVMKTSSLNLDLKPNASKPKGLVHSSPEVRMALSQVRTTAWI